MSKSITSVADMVELASAEVNVMSFDQVKEMISAKDVLRTGFSGDVATLEREIIALVRQKIGLLAALKDFSVTPRRPNSRSGKVLRKIIRRLANGKPCHVPAIIEEPDTMRDIEAAFSRVERRKPEISFNT